MDFKSQKEVAESAFDFLHIEMVNYVSTTTPAGPSQKVEKKKKNSEKKI